MRTTKTKTVTEERLVIEDVICNKCGKSCRHDMGHPDGKTTFAHRGLYRGGYGSDPLEDMMDYKWDMCEPCLKLLFDSFAIPVETGGYSVMDELYGVGPQ